MQSLVKESETTEAVKLINNLDDFRVNNLLKDHSSYTCLLCQSEFEKNPKDSGIRFVEIDRSSYQLCRGCFHRTILTGTQEGREAVEKALRGIIPPVYQDAEFKRFETYSPYSQQMMAIRQQVITWTRGASDYVLSNQTLPFPGNLYLYSERGEHGSGCGNGKTLLAYSAFKYLARRLPYFDPAWGLNLGNLVFGIQFMDLQGEVTRFLDKIKDPDCSRDQICTFSDYRGYRPGISFNQYIELRSTSQVLILDDVGRRPNMVMTADLHADLMDRRLACRLPTLFTSNFSPKTLETVIGDRAASRIIRGDCQVVELLIPDYAYHRINNRGMS